jgi:hypothetical protein
MTDFDGATMEKIEENNLKDFTNNTGAHKELECLLKGLESGGSDGGSGIFCPHSYDTLLCWPRTPAGMLAVLPCFEELNGIKYDTNRTYYSIIFRVFIFKICLL